MRTFKNLTTLIIFFAIAFCLFCITSFAASQSLQETKTAYAPYGSPTVDGYYDDIWDNSDRLYFVYDRQGSSVDNLAEKYEYESDDERNWVKVMWDEEFLYLFYYFYDTDIHIEDTIAEYNRDGVEFYIDEYNEKAATKAESRAMYQIGICMTEGYADFGDSYVNCYVSSEGKYHFVELQYQFKKLKPTGGEIIGFDASVNVNDTGKNVRDHCLSWNDRTNTTYKYPVYMGDCVLLPKNYTDDFEYVVEKDENGNDFVIVTGYNGVAERVSVPMMLDGKYVLAVAKDAFDGDTNLKQLTLPLTVILFGDINVATLENVFVNEDNLIYYTENGVVFSKNDDFLVMYPCAHLNINYSVPSHVVNIYPGAFNGAKNLKQVILPEGLENIYSDNFSNCEALEEINIPKSVLTIEENVGANCKNLVSVSLLSKNISIGEGFLSNSSVKVVELYRDNDFEDKLTGNYHKIYLGEEAKVRVSSANVLPGDTFSVDILIENNTGISGMMFKLEYDREKLELLDVSYENSFWEGVCNFHDESSKYPIEFVFYRTENTIKNGIIATLTFKAIDTALDSVTEIGIKFTGDVINSSLDTVNFDTENAVVKLKREVSGDVNNDGTVDIKDVVLLSQYLAGWHVEIASNTSDCNSDGSINIKDIILLVQYLSGWQVDIG